MTRRPICLSRVKRVRVPPRGRSVPVSHHRHRPEKIDRSNQMSERSHATAILGPLNTHLARALKSPRAHLHVVRMLRFTFWTETNRARPLFFFLLLFCSCFCLCGPFNCISFHKLSRQLSAFSLSSSGRTPALLALSTI